MKPKLRRPSPVTALLLLLFATAPIAFVIYNRAKNAVSYNENAANEAAAKYANQARSDINKCPALPPEKQLNCRRTAADRAREEQRREYEVEAYQNSAVWSEVMGEAALMGVLFTLITIIVIYRTYEQQVEATAHARRQFLHARHDALIAGKMGLDSLRASKKLAAASAKQVRIAQEAAYRQLRAYVSIENPRVTAVGKDSLSGELTVRNAGQTPAAIELYLAAWIGKYPLLEAPEGCAAPFRFTFHGPYINAKSAESVTWFYQLSTSKPQQDATAEIARVMADPVGFALYLYGRIEFVDYKRHRRVLKYAFRNEGALTLGDKGDKMIPTPWGNEYEDRDKGKA